MSDTEFFGDNGENDPFWAELGRGPAPEAEATPEPETVEAPAEPEGRPRNPDGTFAPKVAAEQPEAVEEPDEQPEAEAEPEAASDAEDLKAQIAALEKRLADKDDFAGRLSNELGELRKLQEQIAERQAQPQVSDWESLIEDNPARAAQIALQAGNTYAYQQAKEAWEDLAPGAPEVFEQNLRLQRQMEALEAKLAETTAPIVERQNTEQVTQAYKAINEKYPDFNQFEDAMAEAVETRPLIKKALRESLSSGDVNTQVAFLEDLYLITAGRKSDTLREAQKEVAQSLAAETLQAKQDAIVVSATSNASEPTRPGTWWDVAEADEAERASGWNIS